MTEYAWLKFPKSARGGKKYSSIWREHIAVSRATFLQTARFSEQTECPRTKTSRRILFSRQMGAMSIKSRQRANARFLMQKSVQLTLRTTLEKRGIFGKPSTRVSMDWSSPILFPCRLKLYLNLLLSLLRHILLGYSLST